RARSAARDGLDGRGEIEISCMINQSLRMASPAAFHLSDKNGAIPGWVTCKVVALEPGGRVGVGQYGHAAGTTPEFDVAEAVSLRAMGEARGQMQLAGRQHVNHIAWL